MQHPDTEQNTSPLPFRNHTALLLATALPYLQPAYRHPVELILKFLEFSETVRLYQEFHTNGNNPFAGLFQESFRTGKESGLFGLINTFILDIEGLLGSLSKVCTGDEKEIINMFLNLIRAKNFYENYGDLMKMFMSSAAPQENPPENAEAASPGNTPSGFSMPNMASLFAGGDFTGMLNEEQSETLNLLKSLFESE